MILNCDALHFMCTMADESVDLIVTDPPYRTISGGNSSGIHERCSGILAKNDGKIFKHNDISCVDYLPEFYRILKPGSDCYVMTNNLNLTEMLNVGQSVGFKFSNLLVWEKNTCTPNRRYMKNCEWTLFFYKPPSRTINNPSSKQLFKFDNPRDKIHPTEKPVQLMKHYIENSSAVGDLVIDPFCGSGASYVAARDLGRRFIGCEIDPEYYEVARDR
jgi:site-specific DNA-methyltransferase (adenine-specific)